MPAARAQAFTVVTDGGAAVAAHGCGGCCACRPPRRGGSVQLVGDRADGATVRQICDWVRRQLR
jgi:hypothetical protein